jgi:hypothetical protein
MSDFVEWNEHRNGESVPPLLGERIGLENNVEMVSIQHLNPERLFVRRVTACVGWAVHGVVFEFVDGTRRGVVLTNGGSTLGLDNLSIETRGGRWVDVEPWDTIQRVSGHQLRNARPYLCHSLTIDFASGRSASFHSHHEPWKGEAFSYDMPDLCLPYMLRFGTSGKCIRVVGLQSSIHWPLSPEMKQYLPVDHQNMLLFLCMVARRFDKDRRENQLGKDVWWKILSHLKGHNLMEWKMND